MGHLFRVIPTVGSALSECAGQLGESSTVAVIGEEGLVLKCPSNNGRSRESGGAGGQWVHAPEGLLDRLECPGNSGGSEVDEVCVGNQLRHEAKPVDIEVAQATAQFVRSLSTFVGQLSQLAADSQLADMFNLFIAKDVRETAM